MGVIVDSGLFIAAERGRFALASFLTANATTEFFISAATAAELLHGCARAIDAGIRRRREQFVEDILTDFALLPFGLREARVYAQLWADLERRGTLIGDRDLQIAATAAAGQHGVATLNRREFSRIATLRLIAVGAFSLTPP